jgi:hypothetical protein
MSDTLIKPEVGDPALQNEDPHYAHIVEGNQALGGETVNALLFRSAVEGTPIRALCGKVWVPSRDPLQLPLCEGCKVEFEKRTGQVL